MSSQSLGGSDPKPDLPSQAVNRTAAKYLFAISTLSKDESDRVTTGEIQDYLDVSPASVTQMVTKLAERGLVDHEKYEGVYLTDDGEVIATRMIRQFCAVTNFFDSVLDTVLDEQSAFEIGYQLPDEAIDRLRDLATGSCFDICPESAEETNCCHA